MKNSQFVYNRMHDVYIEKKLLDQYPPPLPLSFSLEKTKEEFIQGLRFAWRIRDLIGDYAYRT